VKTFKVNVSKSLDYGLV